MLPATLQFRIAMVAHAIHERMVRRVDYLQEEVRVLREAVAAATGKSRIDFTAEQRRRLALKGKQLTAEERRACCQQAGRNAAIGLMVGDGAVAGGGVGLIVLDARTKVSQTGNPPAGIADPPPRPITWRGDRPEQRPSPSMMGVQIVQGVF